MVDIIILVILGYGALIFKNGCLLFIRDTIGTSVDGRGRGGGGWCFQNLIVEVM